MDRFWLPVHFRWDSLLNFYIKNVCEGHVLHTKRSGLSRFKTKFVSPTSGLRTRKKDMFIGKMTHRSNRYESSIKMGLKPLTFYFRFTSGLSLTRMNLECFSMNGCAKNSLLDAFNILVSKIQNLGFKSKMGVRISLSPYFFSGKLPELRLYNCQFFLVLFTIG